MPLYFIGLGLRPDHITLQAIRLLGEAEKVYVDAYTSIIPGFSPETLRRYTRGEIIVASRRDLEQGMDRIIEEAVGRRVAVAVPGDPFIATTHDAIRSEALRRGVEVKVAHNVSIYSAAASATGLQAYRFGKTTTLVYPEGFKPFSTIETIRENYERRLHSLVLLDLRLEEGRAMRISEAVDIAMRLEEEYCGEQGCTPILPGALAVGLARIASDDQVVRADLFPRLKRYTYPDPPHSIIVVSDPHPVELDSLLYIARLPRELYAGLSRGRG